MVRLYAKFSQSINPPLIERLKYDNTILVILLTINRYTILDILLTININDSKLFFNDFDVSKYR